MKSLDEKEITIKTHLFYIGLLITIFVVMFSKFIFSDQMLFGSDLTGAFGSRVFYKHTINEEKSFPLWLNPRLSGMPTVEALAGDALYPPSILIKSIFPEYKASPMVMILHLLFAGICFYIMMVRAFRAPPLAAFIGAVFFMLTPSTVSLIYAGHDSKLMVVSWIPFLIWRLKEALDKPTIFNGSMITLGVTMSLLTGHIQMVYFMLWGLFLYWATWTVLTIKKGTTIKSVIPQALVFWLPIFLSLFAAATQFYPVMNFISKNISVRGVNRGFEFATSWSLHWPELFSLIVPEFVNSLGYYWGENPFKLNTEYIGILTLLFGVLSVVIKPRPWRIYWTGFGLIMLAFAMGNHTPIFRIFYTIIPGVSKFRAPSMIIFWVAFSTIFLSALFFKDVARGELENFSNARKLRWTKGLVILSIVITFLALIFSSESVTQSFISIFHSFDNPHKLKIFQVNFSTNFVPKLWIAYSILMVAIWSLWAVIKKNMKVTTFLLIILILGLYDQIRVDNQFLKIESPRAYFRVPRVIKEVQSEMPKDPFRVFYLPGTYKFQNVAGVHRMEGVMGFHDNELNWYREFRGGSRGMNFLTGLITTNSAGQSYLNIEAMPYGNNFLDIANVRYIFGRGRDGKIIRIKNDNAFGRISFAPNYIVMNEKEISNALSKGTYNPKTTVALLEDPNVKPSASSDDTLPKMKVTWKKYFVNERIADIVAPADGFLRISEVYFPDWEISVDGKLVKKYRADLSWIAVPITKGEHTITMCPHSYSFELAAKVAYPIQLLLLIYWFLYGISTLLKHKNKKVDNKES